MLVHQRRADSKQSRLRQYFQDNPEEELTMSDVAAKLGCTFAQAQQTVKSLQQERGSAVEYVHVIRRKEKGRFTLGGTPFVADDVRIGEPTP